MKVVHFADLDYQAASHEDPADPGALKKVLLTYQDLAAGQVQMVNWVKIAPGKSFKPHYHEDMQEIFIIINGIAQIRVGTEEAILNRGDCVLVPEKTIHKMKNVGQTTLEYVVFGIAKGQGGKTVVV